SPLASLEAVGAGTFACPTGEDEGPLRFDSGALCVGDGAAHEGLPAVPAGDVTLDAEVAQRRTPAVAQGQRAGHAGGATSGSRLTGHLVQQQRADPAVHEPGRALVGSAEVHVGPGTTLRTVLDPQRRS